MWWHRQNHGFRVSLEVVDFNVGFDDLRPAAEKKGHKIAPTGQIKSHKKSITWQGFFFFVEKMVLGRSGKSGLAFMWIGCLEPKLNSQKQNEWKAQSIEWDMSIRSNIPNTGQGGQFKAYFTKYVTLQDMAISRRHERMSMVLIRAL